jgi:hypothetical protein
MRPLVITGVARAESLPAGDGALLELQTSEGALELRFTFEDGERLIAAVQAAREKLQAERVHAARPPLPENDLPVVGWETAIDPINQEAILRARYPDETLRETRIPRRALPDITQFLDQARRRFEGSADMRQ